MSKSKRPRSKSRPVNAGDTVRVKDNWNDQWLTGVVRVPMDRQFSWTTPDGSWFYCMYDGEWELVDED